MTGLYRDSTGGLSSRRRGLLLYKRPLLLPFQARTQVTCPAHAITGEANRQRGAYTGDAVIAAEQQMHDNGCATSWSRIGDFTASHLSASGLAKTRLTSRIARARHFSTSRGLWRGSTSVDFRRRFRAILLASRTSLTCAFAVARTAGSAHSISSKRRNRDSHKTTWVLDLG